MFNYRSRIRWATGVLLGLACGVTLLVSLGLWNPTARAGYADPTAGQSAAPSICGELTVVTSPNYPASNNRINAVVALASDNAWSVGDYNDGVTVRAIIQHWTGSFWGLVQDAEPGFDHELFGITALAPNNIWAVGTSNIGNSNYNTLTEHWDGASWSIVPSPNTPGHTNILNAVAGASANDVWAVGYSSVLGNAAVDLLIEHWNGTAWSIFPIGMIGTGNTYLASVVAIAVNDVWAVGYYQNGAPNRGLVMHWNGTVWQVVPATQLGSINTEFTGVSAVNATNIWAVGQYNNGAGYKTLIERWNGSTWDVVSSPNVGANTNFLEDVSAKALDDVWAVGEQYSGTNYQTVIEHWDGSAWSVVTSASPGTGSNNFHAVAAVGPENVWAVGDQSAGTTVSTLIERFTPCATPTGTPTSTPTSTDTPTSTETQTATDVPTDTATATNTHTNTPTAIPSDTATNTATSIATDTRTPLPTQTTAGATATLILTSSATRTPTSPAQASVTATLPAGSSTSTITATPTVCTLQFTDVPGGSTFYPFIRCLACLGIVNGYGDNTFRPDNDVTRGQLSKMASNSAGFADPQPLQMFEDVPITSTFHLYIGRLASRGYISGYQCGAPGEPCGNASLPYFRPNASATRGQISKIVSNTAGYTDVPSGQQFEDVAVGSAYYVYSYRLLIRDLMSGYPCSAPGEPCVPPNNLPYLRPNSDATRGQTSKIVGNAFFPDCQIPQR